MRSTYNALLLSVQNGRTHITGKTRRFRFDIDRIRSLQDFEHVFLSGPSFRWNSKSNLVLLAENVLAGTFECRAQVQLNAVEHATTSSLSFMYVPCMFVHEAKRAHRPATAKRYKQQIVPKTITIIHLLYIQTHHLTALLDTILL